MMITNVILLLAGKSERFNSDNTLKQFISINNKDLFLFSLEKFIRHKKINSIFLVVPSTHIKYVEDKIKQYKIMKKNYVIEGATTRQLSVFNALKAIKENEPCDNVLIHDAVRPGITTEIIDEHIKALDKYEAISTILDINDSIISSKVNLSSFTYLKREETYLIQTPQTFSFNLIFNAHLKEYNNHSYNAKDDLSLIDKSISVKFVKGSICNLKVTTPDDLELIKSYLSK